MVAGFANRSGEDPEFRASREDEQWKCIFRRGS